MLVNMSGGKKVENIINEIVQPDLLWTNARPTSSFANGTTVSVNGSGYTYYIIEVRFDSTTNFVSKAIVPVGYVSYLFAMPSATSTSNFKKREITATSATGLTFGYGQLANNATNNNSAIPTRIWGVKFTL